MSRTRRTLAAGALLLAVACATARETRVPPPVPPRPVPELVASLGDQDPSVRARAAWALVGAEAGEPGLGPALIAALDDPDRSVREAATWTARNLRGELKDLPEAKGLGIVRQTKPLYPQPAFNKKVEGVVVVRMLVGEEGRVVHAEVRQSVRGLDAAALGCVREWVFTPAQREGRPVAMVAEAPVSFRIY